MEPNIGYNCATHASVETWVVFTRLQVLQQHKQLADDAFAPLRMAGPAAAAAKDNGVEGCSVCEEGLRL